jgi:hypothetical protein
LRWRELWWILGILFGQEYTTDRFKLSLLMMAFQHAKHVWNNRSFSSATGILVAVLGKRKNNATA